MPYSLFKLSDNGNDKWIIKDAAKLEKKLKLF
jgi:hypothetical protein